MGYAVQVSHPRKTRYIAEEKIKSDRVDSKAIAELVRLDALPSTYIKPKRSSVERAKGCWAWRDMVCLFREHPRVFNRVYQLRPRMEAWWRSLKSLVGDLVRSRTSHETADGDLRPMARTPQLAL